MAKDPHIEFIDACVEKYKKLDNSSNVSSSYSVLEILLAYYDLVLVGKLRVQRGYCKQKIYEINPGFAKGYFETSRKKDKS